MANFPGDEAIKGPLDSALDYTSVKSEIQIFKQTTIPEIPMWVNSRFLSDEPFAFLGRGFSDFRRITSESLDVEFHNVWCTGSGALGFSLNPSKTVEGEAKHFDITSDLDIAIVSTHYFDLAWKDLREKSKSFEGQQSRTFERKIEAQRGRLFDGAIRTDILLGGTSFSLEWRAGQAQMRQYVATKFGREVSVKFWIYRDMWSLRYYIAEGARKLKGNL